jgi:predicted lipoprotein with Yx(FWY)xxD motif
MKLVTGVLGVAILGMVGYLATTSLHTAAKPQVAAAVTVPQMPAGITFNIVGGQIAMSAMGAFKGYPVITNEKKHTIYTSDADTTPDKSSCTGDCAKDWVPLAAPDDAKPSGFWHVITRDDGTKQWSRRGKPLYTYASDKNVGDIKGASVEGWHWVLNNALYGIPTPDGIVSEEMVAAGGQALVDAKQRTLYAFTGDLKNDKVACAQGATCDNGFTPVVAAQLAEPVSDFTPISRADGTRQWAFQGQPLYTYDGDAEHGDSKGRAVDPRYHVALAEKYFQPDNVAFGINVRGMDYLTDAKGMTIYARDRFHFQVGGFSLRGGQAGVPQLGQFLGTSTCTGDCTKTWIPVAAPDGAKPAGYWSVMKRKEGGSQWAYMGYALYTYTGDQKPGDETSHDNFDISLGKTLPAIPQNPIDAVSALYWREVLP